MAVGVLQKPKAKPSIAVSVVDARRRSQEDGGVVDDAPHGDAVEESAEHGGSDGAILEDAERQEA